MFLCHAYKYITCHYYKSIMMLRYKFIMLYADTCFLLKYCCTTKTWSIGGQSGARVHERGLNTEHTHTHHRTPARVTGKGSVIGAGNRVGGDENKTSKRGRPVSPVPRAIRNGEALQGPQEGGTAGSAPAASLHPHRPLRHTGMAERRG